MTGCQHSCRGKDQRAYRIALSKHVVVACADHYAYLTGQGLTLIETERRLADAPVASDRRRFVARWLRGGAARDLTGWLR